MPVMPNWVVVARCKEVFPATVSVPVAVRFEPVTLLFAKMSPATESLANGVVVPMPMFPVDRAVPAALTPVPNRRLPMVN